MACHSSKMFDEVVPTLPDSAGRVKHLFERGGPQMAGREKKILPIVINGHIK